MCSSAWTTTSSNLRTCSTVGCRRSTRTSAPKFITREDGASVWVYEGHTIESWGINAVVGRPQDEWGFEPHSYDEVRPGVYDVHSRVKDMSANGEWAALNFPSFATFSGSVFAVFAYRDADQATEMFRAYNDWHLDGWCAEYPDRFIPCGLLPVHDVDAMVEEVHRLADRGCHAVSFMGAPYPFPSFYTDHWDRFFSAAQDLGTVVCMHLGAGMSVYNMVESIEDAPPNPPPEVREGPTFRYVGISATPGSPMAVAADLLNSHLFERFPTLKVALSEGGVGWIPYFLDECDHRYRHHGPWTGASFSRMPSEIFKEHVFACFIDEIAGVHVAMDFYNPDLVGWESDYPHSDGVWPDGPETVAKSVEGLSDDQIRKVTWENAATYFQFDLFANRSFEQCTVGAIRAEVADWDISIQSGFQHRPSETMTHKLMHGKLNLEAPVPAGSGPNT